MTFPLPEPPRRAPAPPEPWASRPPISPLYCQEGLTDRFRTRFLEMLGRHDEPERVAASFAIGVAIAFTPLLGFHWVLAFFLAILLKLNKLDVLLGTLVVNPLTLGPATAVALPLGGFILRARHEAVAQLPWSDVLRPAAWLQAGPAMRALGVQWGVGMLALSVFLGTATYLVLVRVVRSRRDRAAAIPPGFAD